MLNYATQHRGVVLVVALSTLMIAWGGDAHAADRPPIGVKKGQMYPDFLLPTVDGKLHRFSEYRGKKVLLFHFASW